VVTSISGEIVPSVFKVEGVTNLNMVAASSFNVTDPWLHLPFALKVRTANYLYEEEVSSWLNGNADDRLCSCVASGHLPFT
jgi:hypothetical protein